MKATYALLGLFLFVGLAISGGAAADAAEATIEGQCTDDDTDQGQRDSASVSTDGPAVDEPDHAQENLEACAAGASSGDTPDGGSFLAASGSAADGAAEAGANTVAVSDLATGVDDTTSATIQAEGACRDGDGNGGQDQAHVSADSNGDTSVDGVDEGETQDALTACAANGGAGPGSFLRASVTALEDDDGDKALTASVDTVPLSNAAPS